MTQVGTVNSRVLDSVVQGQAATVAQGAAQSIAMVNAVLAETLGMSMHNAVSSQRHAQLMTSASITATCARLLNTFPPPPPPPAASDPTTPGDDDGGGSGTIARDTQAAQAAIAKLVTDGGKAASAQSAALSGLQGLSTQVTQGEKTIDSDGSQQGGGGTARGGTAGGGASAGGGDSGSGGSGGGGQ